MQHARQTGPFNGSPMNEGTLYERTTPAGTLVRIRRTSAQGVTPVVAVLEQLVVSGANATRGDGVEMLSLLEVMVQTELDAVILLEPYARTEASVERLARTRQ
jgi:hypothetical protein